MNNYIDERRRRGRNLLIVEGKHEKNELFALIFRCFPEINVDMEDVWIYGTNIYTLYGDIVKEYGVEWTVEDVDLPYVISKKQTAHAGCRKEDFVNIILVFDYERHDPNFSEKKIREMQGYFVDAADTGQLYINYPMIESYQHLCTLPDEEYAERKIPVSLQPGKKYKDLVRVETGIAHLVEFPHKVRELLNAHFGITDEQACRNCYEDILSISDNKCVKERMQEILQNAITGKALQTATCQFSALVAKLGYAHNGNTYWEYMREVFQQIILHNICKANRIQRGRYQVENGNYKDCFENLDMGDILEIQNMASRNVQTGFIWVLNTSVFFVAEYNFSLIG